MDRDQVIQRAEAYAAERFLCSESVLLAISEWLGVKDELIPRVATGFGGGIGGCRSVCGALSGGVIALGLRFGRNDPKRSEERRPYWFAQELYRRFEKEVGKTMCLDLVGYDASTEEGRRRYAEEKAWDMKCRRFIGVATGIVYDIISSESASTESGLPHK